VIYLLDTHILIYLIKNQPPAIAERVDALPDDARLCMSFVTRAELLKGAERRTRKPEVLRRLEALARQVARLAATRRAPKQCLRAVLTQGTVSRQMSVLRPAFG
jgi:predicted nucleic acid-binding protein